MRAPEAGGVMKNAYSDEWWNGIQVLGWILFRARETVDELGDGTAQLLLEMIDKAPHELLAPYVSKFPQERALDELLQAMRTDRLKWSYSTSTLRGTPEMASRLDLALHHHYGMYAHGPLSNKPVHELSELRFRRADVLMQWLTQAEGPCRTPSNSPYWDVLQILAWVATRSPYWTDFADGFESGSHMAVVPDLPKSITGKPYREQRHHRGVALAMLMLNISREKREFGIDLPPPQELWLKVVAAHESGALKLIGMPADGGEPASLAPHALQGCEIYENAQLGAYVSRRTSGVIGRPLWHGLRALAAEVQAAFPRPRELQITVSWTALEDEPSPHVDFLAAVDWIARLQCAEIEGDSEGPHENTLPDGMRAQPYSFEKWEAAKEKLRHKLQSESLVATGYRTGVSSRDPVPAHFWIDALIDDFHSNAFVPSTKHIYIDGDREPMRSDVGWTRIKVPKSGLEVSFSAVSANTLSSVSLVANQPHAASMLNATPRPRGPAPVLRNKIAGRMLKELNDGARAASALEADTEEALRAQYGGSRQTVRLARDAALSEFRQNNSDKTATSDK